MRRVISLYQVLRDPPSRLASAFFDALHADGLSDAQRRALVGAVQAEACALLAAALPEADRLVRHTPVPPIGHTLGAFESYSSLLRGDIPITR